MDKRNDTVDLDQRGKKEDQSKWWKKWFGKEEELAKVIGEVANREPCRL